MSVCVSWLTASTFKLSYTDAEVEAFFQNSIAIAQQTNSPDWPTCLACALVDKAAARQGLSRLPACSACFVRRDD